MNADLTLQLDSEQYVLRRADDGLRIGRSVAGDVTWLDTVKLSVLPEPAREALERGDASAQALLTAVRGIAQAEVERGA